MEPISEIGSMEPAPSGSLVASGIEALRERARSVIVAAVLRLLPTGVVHDHGELLGEFLSAIRSPLSIRAKRMSRLLAELDRWLVGDACTEAGAERFLLLLAAAKTLDSGDDRALPACVQLQLLSQWLLTVEPPKRAVELFRRSTNSFEAACETALLERLPVGQLSMVRSGLPRRTLLNASLTDIVPLAVALLYDMGGFRPAYVTHANGFRRNRFIMLELEARRAYFRMAKVMRMEPAAKGVVTVSWYHDPDLPRVSPHLGWMNSIIQEGGGRVFRGALASEMSGTFENSTARQAAAANGNYTPREGIVVWPREAILAWADRQIAVDDDEAVARRVGETLDSLGHLTA